MNYDMGASNKNILMVLNYVTYIQIISLYLSKLMNFGKILKMTWKKRFDMPTTLSIIFRSFTKS